MRKNNRGNHELREIKFTKDFTKHALGSVLVEFGDTKVITTASVDKKKKAVQSLQKHQIKINKQISNYSNSAILFSTFFFFLR